VRNPERPIEHLDLNGVADRGLAHMPKIPGTYGGDVMVYMSSAAVGPHVWLSAADQHGRSGAVHLTAEAAWKLAEQLMSLVRNHYQGDATPEWARTGTVDVDPIERDTNG
jgi:hypothetical protein